MTHFSEERAAEMRELFFESAQELLQALNDDALQLEKRPNDGEIVRAIRRTVHTLKGDAAACGFRELSELAHELEDALGLEPAPSSAALAEVAFTAADAFGAMLASYRGKSTLPSSEPLRKLVHGLAEHTGEAQPRKREKIALHAGQSEWTEYEKLAVQNALTAGQNVYHVKVEIDPGCAMPIAARQLLINSLAPLGEVLGTRPEAGSTLPAKVVELLFASGQTANPILEKCRIPTVSAHVRMEKIWHPKRQPASQFPAEEETAAPIVAASGESSPAAAPAGEPAAAGKPQAAHSASENILRVEAARIDNVLNLVGELIIGKSMLQQTLTEFSRLHPKDPLRGRFADALAFQSRVLNDLQRSVMKVRMVPVEQLFRRFPRMVRDVAKQCGKDVELVISGQDTDLDKSLLDTIAEPIAHLVRNAVSHGIEDPAGRTGKPARAVIRLDAYHQGNQVIVEICDDGRGMDVRAIKAKAIEQGLTSREEAERLLEAEVLDFVFRPGFSTAKEITEISGRGVGLDVVRSVMQRLKGQVEILTQPGKGTTFRLKLPLTLAIIKALLFRVEQRLYAIPLNAVAEIARARELDLHLVDRYEVLQLRGQVLQLARLGRARQPQADGRGKIFVLVIALGERKLGLIVDSLEGEEELVIKALDDQTIDADLVSGASILGDGRVVLILNLAAIMERCTKAKPSGEERVPYGLLLSHADRVRLKTSAAGGKP